MASDWICPILAELWPLVLDFLHLQERLTVGATCKVLKQPSRSIPHLDVSYLGSLYTLGVVDRQYGVSGLVQPSEYPAILEYPLHAQSFTVMQSHEGQLASFASLLPATNWQAQRLIHRGLRPLFMRMFAVAQVQDASVLQRAGDRPTMQAAEAAAATWLTTTQFTSILSIVVKLSMGNLQTLIAVDCHLDAAWLARAAAWLPALTSLHIASTVQRRANSGCTTLASVLIKQYPRLEELDVSGADLGVHEISQMLSEVTRLRNFTANSSAACGAPWYSHSEGEAVNFYSCNWVFLPPPASTTTSTLRALSLLNVAQGFLHELLPAACETCPWLQEVIMGYLPRSKNVIEPFALVAHQVYPVDHCSTLADVARLDINPAVLHSCNYTVGKVPRLFGHVLSDVNSEVAARALDEMDAFELRQPEVFAHIYERCRDACRHAGLKHPPCSRECDRGYVSPATWLWCTAWYRVLNARCAANLRTLRIEGRAPINDAIIELVVARMPKLRELQVEGLTPDDGYYSADDRYGIIRHTPSAEHDDISHDARVAAARILSARR
jgi:hypothetical protein